VKASGAIAFFCGMKKTFPWQYILLALLVAYCFARAKAGGDFDVFLDAAAKMSRGENIYQPPFIRKLQYYYSPLFARLLVPFARLPFWLPEFGWLLLSAWWLGRIWRLSQWYFEPNVLTVKEYRWWVGLLVLLTLRFLLYNFSMIQVTIFLLWATLESLRLFRENRIAAGSALLGFAMNVKLLPLLALPYLVYRGQWRGAAGAAAVFGICLFLPALFLGWETNDFLLREWWRIVNPTNGEHMVEAENGPHSLVAFLPVFLTATSHPDILPIRRNILSLDIEQVVWITNAARFALAALMLVFLRTWPLRPAPSRLHEYRELAYLLLLTPLLFPHQQKYAFVYLAPALLYLLWFFILARRVAFEGWRGWLALFFVVSVEFTPLIGRDVITNYAYEWLQHFRVLTVAALLLIPLLWACAPERAVTQK
jgi:hypothetical protein